MYTLSKSVVFYCVHRIQLFTVCVTNRVAALGLDKIITTSVRSCVASLFGGLNTMHKRQNEANTCQHNMLSKRNQPTRHNTHTTNRLKRKMSHELCTAHKFNVCNPRLGFKMALILAIASRREQCRYKMKIPCVLIGWVLVNAYYLSVKEVIQHLSWDRRPHEDSQKKTLAPSR